MMTITTANEMKKVMDEAFDFSGQMMAKYGFGDLDTLANVDAEDFKNFQTMLQLSIRLKEVSFAMAQEMDQMAERIEQIHRWEQVNIKQNEEILSKLEELETKLSKKSQKSE